MADQNEALREMLSQVLAPLIEADGGELYLVMFDKTEVRLHLAGTYSGSPAKDLTTLRVVEPAVKAIIPKAKVFVSSGWSIPDGAERVQPQ